MEVDWGKESKGGMAWMAGKIQIISLYLDERYYSDRAGPLNKCEVDGQGVICPSFINCLLSHIAYLGTYTTT